MHREITGRKRILVADDDDHVRKSLEYALSEEGFETSGASSGREALETLRAEPFDLLLIDDCLFDMPLDDILTAVRSFEIQPLIVVLQAVPRLGAAARFAALGASDAVGRWNSRRDIIETVRHCLASCELEKTHA
jgi:two-component system, OmpR family, alkaline phosphatase synthesis response regulator PhoP